MDPRDEPEDDIWCFEICSDFVIGRALIRSQTRRVADTPSAWRVRHQIPYRNNGSKMNPSWGFGLTPELEPGSAASADLVASPATVASGGGCSAPLTPQPLTTTATAVAARTAIQGFVSRGISIKLE